MADTIFSREVNSSACWIAFSLEGKSPIRTVNQVLLLEAEEFGVHLRNPAVIQC